MNSNGVIEEGEINSIEKYFKVLGNLQIAPPNNSNVPKNKTVLNDEDIINLVFFDSPASNFLNFEDPIDDNRHWLDKVTDHFIDGTYLNAYGSVYDMSRPNSLFQLKEFTLQSLVDTASLLESNCFEVLMGFEIRGLEVSFEAFNLDDSLRLNPNLRYIWKFGDGTETQPLNEPVVVHRYNEPGLYTVQLLVTDIYNNNLGEGSLVEKRIFLDNFIQGCNFESGAYHINPDGSIGGFVSNSATVASTSYVDSRISICGTTQVLGNSKITNGNLNFVETFRITNSLLIDTILSGASGSIAESNITGSNVIPLNYVEINYSNVDQSELSAPSIGAFTSTIQRSKFISTDSQSGRINLSVSTISDSQFSAVSMTLAEVTLSGKIFNGDFIDISAGQYVYARKNGVEYIGPLSQYVW